MIYEDRLVSLKRICSLQFQEEKDFGVIQNVNIWI